MHTFTNKVGLARLVMPNIIIDGFTPGHSGRKPIYKDSFMPGHYGRKLIYIDGIMRGHFGRKLISQLAVTLLKEPKFVGSIPMWDQYLCGWTYLLVTFLDVSSS